MLYTYKMNGSYTYPIRQQFAACMGFRNDTRQSNPENTYQITVYALDTDPDLESGFSLDELLTAIDGHVLAQAMLEAQYSN